MVEAEHIRFDYPGAGRHSFQLKLAFFAGHGGQNLVALGRFDYCARNHLTFRL
jgi:hypothetical protein